MPKISVLMSVYNEPVDWMRQAIESILNQTYKDFEFIIVNDNPEREENQLFLNEYRDKDSRIIILCNEHNIGLTKSLNKGLAVANGEYIARMDADDIALPERLEKQLVFMEQHNCDFCYCSYEHISEDGKSLGEQTRVVKNLTYNKMLMHCWPGCLTVIYRQDLNHKIYAEDIKKNNDHALFLRVLKHCHNAMGMKECMGLYRICKGSISRNKFKMFKPYLKVIRDFEGKSIIYAWFCIFTHIFIKFFLKYRKIQKEESVVENMRDSFTLYKDY